MSREGYHPRIREVGQRCQSRKAGVVSEGVEVSEIAGQIETSQPAHWARLKFEEALLRLRHSLPQRDEVAKTAAKAAASLGIDPG